MSSRFLRIAPALVLVLLGLVWLKPGLSGQAPGPALHAQRRVAALHRRHPRHALFAARSDQRVELQQARGRLAVQDRQPRPASRVQARRHAADGQRRRSTRPAARGDRSIALDGRTGELIWVHSLREGQARGGRRRGSCRAAASAYWTDGKGDERVIYVTTGYRLVALNAKTGALMHVVRQGRRRRSEGRASCTATASRSISRPARSASTRRRPSSRTSSSSARRSAKARRSRPTTTPRAWCARSTSRPASCCGRSTRFRGRASSATRPGRTTRGRSTATPACGRRSRVDEELGLVYLPVETPTSDFYGGHRPGNNLFAESLVCVDLKTGQRKWHFQFVHHPLWNFDISSAPLLADITVDGKPIKAVAVPSKQAFLYVFDRVTGQPVWPIEERPVPQSDVPGEKTSPTQPFPTKPPAYARNYREGARRPDRLHAGAARAGARAV